MYNSEAAVGRGEMVKMVVLGHGRWDAGRSEKGAWRFGPART